MSKWLSSTNAKEIGTLYLVFAVFAGIQKNNNHASIISCYMLEKLIATLLIKFILYKFYKREKLNIKPELELGKILYLKGLSAVKKIFWRSLFTQRLYTR